MTNENRVSGKVPEKERLTITIDKELLNWIDEKVSQKVFANRSHALEFLALQRMQK